MNQDPNELLMQAMLGGNLPNPDQAQSMIEQMIAQRSAENPRLGMLLNLLAQRRAAAETEAEENEPVDAPHYPTPQPEPEPHPRNREAVQKLKEKVAAIYLELREMRRRNELFALALGACKECWGSDPGCAACQGQGKPGFYAVDPDLFAQFVEPACAQARPPAKPKPTAGSNGHAERPNP